jgi:Zn-dependent protease with chaperone function
MDSRIRLIVASLVAASVAYLFAVIAFTGTLDLIAGGVFLALFVVVLLVFERFIQWAERFDTSETPTVQP